MAAITEVEALEEFGIRTQHASYDHERRFRLIARDGSCYIRTECTGASRWQDSHKHRMVRETYIVEKGWIVLAEMIDNEMKFQLVEANGIITTSPGIPHNVFTSSMAIFHTVKHSVSSVGISPDNDKFSEPECDAKTKHLSENELLQIVNSPQ